MRKVSCFLLASLLILVTCTALSEDGRSPTTGHLTNRPYRPVLVVLSNAPEARDALRLSQADIVYEAIISGPGHTRYLALFNDAHPEVVGSIRSARPYHGMLRDEWDCPLIFWNAHGEARFSIFEHLRIMNVPDSFIFSGIHLNAYKKSTMTRTKDYVTPHNGIAYLHKIATDFWPTSTHSENEPHIPQLPRLQFSETPARGDEQVHSIAVEYDASNYTASYEYMPDTGTYARSYNGYAMVDKGTNEAIYADNVIIQFCEQSYVSNVYSLPQIQFIATGIIHVYIEGTKIEGRWTKTSPNEPTLYEYSDGHTYRPLVLRPGKTFIQIFPTGYETDDTIETDGSIRYRIRKQR